MNTKSLASPDITRTMLQVLAIGALIGAGAWILSPFLTSIIWATMIVVATWPAMRGLQSRLWGKRGLAVAVMTVILLMAVILPVTLAISTIIERADDVAGWASSLTAVTVPPPPEWLGRIPLAGARLSNRWQHIASLGPEELSAHLAPYAKQVVGWFVAKAGSIGMMLLQFLLTVIISAILYAKGETAASGVISFTQRLAGRAGGEVTVLAAKAIRGVALGIVLTAVMQTTIAGIGLAVVGVPAAALLTAVIFMLCLAQIGPALVLIPALIWVYSKDGVLWGSILLVFSVLALTLDNIVRPILIKKGADLPLILIFAGVIGGLIAFGIIGLFIGPVVLAVTYTLLKAWVSGDASMEAAIAEDGEER